MDENIKYEPIAIVGMGCRFPGSIDSPSAYWELLKNGIDAITDIPKERWNHEYFHYNDRTEAGSIISPQGGFVDDVKCFDYNFFGISANEANAMDPQQRIALQVVWESFEQGGIDITDWATKQVGVFMGAFTADYQFMQLLEPLDYSVYSSTGMMNTMLSNRISHAFNFKGPSMTIDTACSASLTSIHQACRSLQAQDSDLAIGGGSMLMLIPDYHIGETKTGFLSKTGRCQSFSDNADGYVRSEGVGVVVLKRLKDAIRDNDNIQSVIIGSAINQDGHTHGIALPNGNAQKEVIRKACKAAAISPNIVSYVEAHGTGTSAGDPIEANSIGEAYRGDQINKIPLIVGSCKSNIGHTESAAGVAGLIKAVLCLQNEAIPPNLHTHPLNSNIPFDKLGIKIPLKLTALPKIENRLIAGVNSFGFGGSNGHLIIEKISSSIKEKELPYTNKAEETSNQIYLPISANSAESLKIIISNYIATLANYDDKTIHDLGYTAAHHRAHLNYRKLIFVDNKKALAKSLKKLHSSFDQESIQSISSRKLYLVFSGLGSNVYGSSRELYETELVFRTKYDQCNKLYEQISGISMIEAFNHQKPETTILEYQHLQLSVFFHQISLVELFKSQGIKPFGIVGHSAGDFAAFCAAGVYTLEECLLLIHHRINLINKIDNSGRMIAVKGNIPLSFPLIEKFNGNLSIAAYNSPDSISISGNKAVIEELINDFNINKIAYKRLPSNKPYHHKNMFEGFDLSNAILDIKPKPSIVKIFSSTTGKEVNTSDLSPNYWLESIIQPVLFHTTIKEILRKEIGNCKFLEISDRPVLHSHLRNIIKGTRSILINKIKNGRHLHDQTLASLYENGSDLSWGKLIKQGKFTQLNTYPWQKTTAWFESEKSERRRLLPMTSTLLGTKIIEQENQWQSKWSTEKTSWLNQHKILGEHLLPGATYVELALAALSEVMPNDQFVLENLSFNKAVRMSSKSSFFTKVCLDVKQRLITIYATKKLYPKIFFVAARLSYRKLPSSKGRKKNLASKLISSKIINGESLYKLLTKSKYQYGTEFQGIKEFITDGNSSICKIYVDPKFCSEEYNLHPVILDIAFHSALACRFNTDSNQIPFQIPVKLGKVRIYNRPTPTMFAEAKLVNENAENTHFDISLFNSKRKLVAEIVDFESQSLSKSQLDIKFNKDIQDLCATLDWTPHTAGMSFESGEKLVFIVGSSALKRIIIEQTNSIKDQISVCLFNIDKKQTLNRKTEMMKALFEGISSEDTVVNCLALKANQLEDVIPQICEPIIALSKTILETDHTGKVWFVSQNAQSISQQVINPIQSTLWGIARVFCNQEHQNNSGGIIDIGSNNDFSEIVKYIRSNNIEKQIVIRDKLLHKLRLNPINLIIDNDISFGENSPYLITGAFGALGREVVEWMIQKGVKSFIFTTSKPMSSDESCAKSIFVNKIIKKGAYVNVVSVDLSNQSSITNLKKLIPIQDIAGVIYCAGVVDDKLIEKLDRKSLKRVINTKMIGAWGLHKLFKNVELEHFVLFSSIGSCFPNRGMGNYAAANAGLDGLAHYRKSKGLPALSINWGAWKTGMVSELGLEKHFTKMGIGLLEKIEGIAALEATFLYPSAQIVVQKMDWPIYLEHQKVKSTVFEHYQNIKLEIKSSESKNRSRTNIESRIAEELSDLLAINISEITYNTSLTDLNIDSLSVLVISDLILDEWDVDLSIDKLQENMCINDIKQYIDLQKSKMINH